MAKKKVKGNQKAQVEKILERWKSGEDISEEDVRSYRCITGKSIFEVPRDIPRKNR